MRHRGCCSRCVLAAPGAAHGEFLAGRRPRVRSRPSAREQARRDDHRRSTSPQDGRYVAFQTAARNLFADDDPDPPGPVPPGRLFRRDLATGALELVAVGDLRPTRGRRAARSRRAEPVDQRATGATSRSRPPTQLVPADTNTERRRLRPRHDAADRRARRLRAGLGPRRRRPPAAYGGRRRARPAPSHAGAAISADGRKVVFCTRARVRPAGRGPRHRPAGQLFVRDLRREHDHARDAQHGGRHARRRRASAAAGRASARTAPRSRGPGTNAALADALAARARSDRALSTTSGAARDGPSAPTRRITGASDLDDPLCRD